MSHPADTDGDCRALFALPGQGLYLDTAAHAPMLRSARDAGIAALADGNRPWTPDAPAWEARVERARALAADWFDGDADAIAFVPSVAYGVATAAHNLPLARGEAVLVLDGQFPSNLLAWQERCQATGAHVAAARRGQRQDWTRAVLATIRAHPELRIAALPQAYWHDGALLDLDAISAALRARGVALVLDLSQSLGALPADVARWKPDFVVSVGYKWLLGPTGLALLWAAPRWREYGAAIEQHWSARDDGQVWRFAPDRLPRFRDGARRFDAGGVLDPLRLGMFEAAQAQLRAWGPERVLSHLRSLLAAFDGGLHAHGLGDWRTGDHAPHLCGVRPEPERFAVIAHALTAARIACTARHGLLRIAPHLHVSQDDMARCIQVMAAAR
ncbi:MAG: aminotransferase class V-fold PLP-dependent enzyme [Luteimonas sp.]